MDSFGSRAANRKGADESPPSNIMNEFNQKTRFSRNTRIVGWVVLVLLIMAVLFAFFSSQLGQNVLLICCGGGILVAVVGILSERGMRRPR